MQSFTIRDVENLTGIKAHTLRIWEQRYTFLSPKRKESLHRIYDNEDLKHLLRIAYLYHNGWKVSKIAALSPEQVLEQARITSSAPGRHHRYIDRLIEAAIDFNEHEFVSVINEASDAIGFERAVTEVCYPYLNKLGLLWSTNGIIPAQEHFSSYIIQSRLIYETERLGPLSEAPGILLTTPAGEFHELPLLFINYLLRKRGRSTLYMGPNSNKDDIKQLAALPSVRSIYLHLITNFTGLFVDDYLEEICRLFPTKTIYASGEGIKGAQRTFTNLRLLRSDADIYGFIGGVTA